MGFLGSGEGSGVFLVQVREVGFLGSGKGSGFFWFR